MTPTRMATMKTETMMMAAILGVLLSCTDDAEEDTSDVEDVEDTTEDARDRTEGVDSFMTEIRSF